MQNTVANQQVYNSTLGDLLSDLALLDSPLSHSATLDTLSALAWHSDELAAFEKFDAHSYQRNRVFRNEFVDILVLCWKAGQRTPLHDHAGSRCGVRIMKGSGTEIAFARAANGVLVPSETHPLKAGDCTVSYDEEVHMMANLSGKNEDLVTLHCYSPPLSGMRIYDQSETFMSSYSQVVERATSGGFYQTPAKNGDVLELT